MNMDACVIKNHIRAPGTMVIRDLELSPSGGIGATHFSVSRDHWC